MKMPDSANQRVKTMITKRMYIHAWNESIRQWEAKELLLENDQVLAIQNCEEDKCRAENSDTSLYMSDGFIDAHAHVYDGATDLGIPADSIGLNTGVHLIADAGSAGAINFPCLKQYVLPTQKTPVRAFLNIGRAGLVTKQPYCDRRVLDVKAALECLKKDNGEMLLGIKVLSSGIIVEDAGLLPLRKAMEAAELAGVRVMAHLVEGPPANEDTMILMRKGDIITHCFHGKPNMEANKKASRGNLLNLQYCSIPNVMWNPDGTPTEPLEKAIRRGVYLDVGHGAGSFDQHVAASAIRAGFRQFSISTDAHIRNVNGAVKNLPHVMTKILALGMQLEDVIRSVTAIPAKQLGISDWCGHFEKRSTIFSVRPRRPEDGHFLDSNNEEIAVSKVIEPTAVILDGRYVSCIR